MYATLNSYVSFVIHKESYSPIILNLIIYDATSPYEKKMKDTLTRYLVTQPNVTFYFIAQREQNEFIQEEDHTLFIKGKDSFIPGILEKTIHSLSYCMSNIPFDYVVRSNISTVLQFSAFPFDEITNYGYSSSHVIDSHFKFASGTNIVLNKAMAQYLLDHQHELLWSEFDDVAIGELMNHVTFPYAFSNPMLFDHSHLNAFSYRHKSNDRFKDAEDMERLVQSLLSNV